MTVGVTRVGLGRAFGVCVGCVGCVGCVRGAHVDRVFVVDPFVLDTFVLDTFVWDPYHCYVR